MLPPLQNGNAYNMYNERSGLVQLHEVLDPLRERPLKSMEYVVRNGTLYVVILVMVALFLGSRVTLRLLIPLVGLIVVMNVYKDV